MRRNAIYTVILVIVLIIGGLFYSRYNFGNFYKSVREKGKTSFSRDNKVKYDKTNSYKIENKEYNDAMFYQTIQVTPNKAYRVTCMVKTENVKNEQGMYNGGAQICVKDTVECSKGIIGNNDWVKLEFYFNSKNRTNVDIGFRLGGYEEKTKGTAWFSSFKLEEGSIDNSNKWNIACFLIDNIEVNIKENDTERNIKLKMSYEDKQDIKSNIRRLPNTLEELSNGKMTAEFDVIEINKKLTSISYDPEYEYYIAQNDVAPLIQEYIDRKEYDYIFIAARLGNLNEGKGVVVHDWIGLGGMDYRGIGFSNIRLPDKENSYIYKYDSRINTFPEEVFVHEFLHTMERNEKEYGNTNIIALHDYERYGYKEESKERLRKWYADYMQNSINNNRNGTGITKNAYSSKPIHNSNLKYSYEIENGINEPQNFIEEIISIINRIKVILKMEGK